MLIHQYIQFYARSFADSPMVIDEHNQMINFSSAMRSINQISHFLMSQNLQAGDRVAILGENSPHHLLLLFAASQLGLVMVPLNFRLTVHELEYIVNDSQAQLILATDTHSLDKAVELSGRIERLSVFHAVDSCVSGNHALGNKAEQKNVSSLEESSDWGDVITSHSSQDISDDVSLFSAKDTVLQLYTSGTTGQPKGVLLRHENLTNLAHSSECGILLKHGSGTLDLIIAPMFHVGGLGTATNAILAGGGVVMHKAFDPLLVADTLEKTGITSAFMVPAMIQALIHGVPNIEQRDFSKLKRIAYGAAPISVALLKQAISIFKCEFVQYFGMTETCGGVLALLWSDHQHALNGETKLLRSCGRALPGTSVKIVNENDEEVSVGQTGEIVMRSNNNMNGYWNLEKATTETLRDGWIYSGDAGYVDEEGYVFLRDRIKDMVVTGGENVYPVEVENILNTHPSILEVAVIGVPDKQYGEALLAIVVVKQDKQLELGELVEHGKEKLAGYKVPRQMKTVEQLPRSATGKVLKTSLREPYWKDHERGVA